MIYRIPGEHLTITPPMQSFIMEVQSLFNKSLKYNLINQMTGIPQCKLFYEYIFFFMNIQIFTLM